MIKKFYLSILTLIILLTCGVGNVWGDELTVHNGTSTTLYAPLYGYYGDQYIHTQIIYPAESVMSGKDITSMTFYMSSKGSKALTSEFQIRLCEVADATFSSTSWKDVSGATLVYEGTLDCNTTTTMTITFQNPYSYSGGNLLFDLQSKTKGSYTSSTTPNFLGENINGSTYNFLYNHNGTSIASMTTGTAGYKLPKVTFVYEAAASCKKPTGLTKSAVTASSASFTWTAGGDETEWQWVCLPAASAVDWSSPAVHTETSASASVTGLSAQTDYKFYVRANCGSDQSAEVVKAFTTPCADYATADLPFEQNFNGLTAGTGLIPDCWSKIANGNYPYIYSSGGVDNSKSLYFSGGASATSSIIILPHFEAPTNTLVISLAYKNNSTYSYYGQFIIGYMTDPADASTFMSLKALDRNNVWSEENKFALTGAPENSYIAIQYGGGSSTGSAYLDNIKVAIPSSCTDPSEVNAEVTSATSATVSWTENGSATAWNIQYSTDNFATHTDVNNVTTNPYTLNGLTANTTYKVRVQANCGAEQSDWVASGEFKTPCEGVTGIGWSEDFETATAGSGKIPDCWQKITNNNSYPQVSNSSSYQKTGSTKCLYFYGGVTGSSEQIAILPPFTEATNTLYVTLDYNNAYYDSYWGETYDYSGDNYGQLSIGYVINSTFTPQESLPRVSAYATASVALTNAPAGSRVAIRYSGGSIAGYLFVDNISISAIPSCVAPSGVAGSASAYNQASISWTANGNESAWKIHYSSDNGENWSDEIAANTNPFTLTGLSANTDYIVQVKALCGGEDVSSWSGSSAPFSTPCAPVDASDFSETMENATATVGHLPDCWQYREKYGSGIPYVYNGSYYAYAGSQCLYFQGGVDESSEQSVLLPEMNQPLNGLTLEFYYKDAESAWSTNAKFTVGYIAADGTTFVPIETLNYAESYTKYTKDLSALPADAKCLAIRFAGGESTAYGYIDNVRVYPTPTCAAPTGVTVSNVTATTADVAWTENNGATAWKIQLSNDGSTWGDAISVSANPYTLENLTPNHTTYYVRVKTICGASDESPWSEASASFETECAAASLPFNESFGADLGCWTKESCYSSTGLYNGAFRFYYNGYGQNPPQYLISPEIDTDNKEVTVEFDYYAESSGYPETFHVGYSTTTKEVAAFTWGAEVTATNTSANTLRYSENLPAGVKFIAIKHTSDDKYYLYIDNFSVTEYIAPACPSVVASTLAASDVTANTATVSWTVANEETAWNLQYKAAGAADWSSIIPVATTPSHNLTSLAANTLYYVRVQADCGGDQSEWTADDAFSFRTDCEQQVVSDASPWSYGFEDTEDGSVPACWDRTEPYANYGYPAVAEYSYYAQSGDKYLYFRTPGRSGSSYTEDAILPVFNTEIKNLKVSFSYFHAAATSNYGQLAIGYVDPSNANAFTQVGDLVPQVEDYTLIEREMPNDAPDGARIAIRCIGSTKGSSYTTTVYVDDIQVSLKPSCYTPTELAAAATSDGAVITWTDDAASKWNLRYRQVAEPEVDWIPANNKTSGFALTGLTPNTEYEVQVQADCEGDGTSAWSASVTFTPVCNAPSALTVTARTQSSATFSWTSSESTWVLQYKAADAAWDAATDVNVNANPFTLTGLSAGTTYNARIQSACGSDFSNVVEFTTWCDSKLSLPVELTSFSAIPACWEESPAGAVEVANSKLCFVGEGERFLYLPMTDINLNLLSVTLTFSGSLDLGYISEPNGAFTSLVEGAVSGTEYDLASLAPAAPEYLAIRYNGASSLAQSAISAVSIRRTPSCLMPSDVAAGSITSSSASISWTAGGTETAWNLQYKKNGAADWNNVAVSTNPFTLSGLEQGTNYKVRVQAACAGEDLSDWSDEASFTTECATIASIPWDADFTFGSSLSACWTVYSESSSDWYKPTITSSGLQIPGGNSGKGNLVILPAFSASLTGATITLRYSCDNGAGHATPQIGYVTDKSDQTTFNVLTDGENVIGDLEKSNSFKTVYLPLSALPAEASNLAIRYADGTSEGNLTINEFRISHVEIFEDLADAENVSRLEALKSAGLIDVVLERPILQNGDYNTICLPFSLSATQLAAAKCPLNGFEVREYDHSDVDLTNNQVDIYLQTVGEIEAGKACFVRLKNGSGEPKTMADFRDVTISTNVITPVDDAAAGIHLIGVFDPHTLLGGDPKNLYLSTGNGLKYPSADAVMKGFRAYFSVDEGGNALPAIRRGAVVRIVEQHNAATGVDEVQRSNVQCTKILEGNQVIIIRNGVKYTIQGQKIQ